MSKVRNCMYRLPPILTNAGDQCSLFRAPCNGTGKDCGLRMHTPESRKRLEEAISDARSAKRYKERNRKEN